MPLPEENIVTKQFYSFHKNGDNDFSRKVKITGQEAGSEANIGHGGGLLTENASIALFPFTLTKNGDGSSGNANENYASDTEFFVSYQGIGDGTILMVRALDIYVELSGEISGINDFFGVSLSGDDKINLQVDFSSFGFGIATFLNAKNIKELLRIGDLEGTDFGSTATNVYKVRFDFAKLTGGGGFKTTLGTEVGFKVVLNGDFSGLADLRFIQHHTIQKFVPFVP